MAHCTSIESSQDTIMPSHVEVTIQMMSGCQVAISVDPQNGWWFLKQQFIVATANQGKLSPYHMTLMRLTEDGEYVECERNTPIENRVYHLIVRDPILYEAVEYIYHIVEDGNLWRISYPVYLSDTFIQLKSMTIAVTKTGTCCNHAEYTEANLLKNPIPWRPTVEILLKEYTMTDQSRENIMFLLDKKRF